MPMPLVGLIMAVLIVAIAMGSTAYYLLTRKPIEEPHPILGAISMPQSSAS